MMEKVPRMAVWSLRPANSPAAYGNMAAPNQRIFQSSVFALNSKDSTAGTEHRITSAIAKLFPSTDPFVHPHRSNIRTGKSDTGNRPEGLRHKFP
jgi:hypothetical protein